MFALFALLALAGVHAVFATDASASAAHAAVATDGSHSTDASASGDSESNWVRVDSGAGGESSDQVLEIPQVACDEDPNSSPCDNDDDGTTGVAAAPRGNDDDTASAGSPDSDWGTADDYLNQPIYGVPYGYVVSRGPVNGNLPGNRPPGRRSPFPFPPMQTSSPITQAARPQLNPTGAWMTPPSMSQFSRPAGSPMASAPFRFR